MDDMDRREVVRFLDGIEEGDLPISDAFNILRTLDPLMGHFLLTYLREKNPVTDTSHGPGERLLNLVSTYKEAANMAKPHEDPMIEWFEDTYSYRQFFNERDEFINLLIEKFEG